MGVLKRTAFVLSAPIWVTGVVVFAAINMAGMIVLLPTLGTAYYIKTGKSIPGEYIHLGFYLDKKYDMNNKVANVIRSL